MLRIKKNVLIRQRLKGEEEDAFTFTYNFIDGVIPTIFENK